jgi:DNA-binding response OmpR family regulator
VLLVEDDRRAHCLLRQILVEFGCEVISAMTQAAGLARIEDDLDCVILDLRLPDGDGETILRKIRATRPGLRVAVLTAESDPERLRRVGALEPDVLLRKPLDPAELVGWLELEGTRDRAAPELAAALH